jgi:hypothetical protein
MLAAAPAFSSLLPSPSEFLSVARVVGTEISLTIGSLYTWGFVGLGPLLMLVGVILAAVMWGKAKYFAMEFGYGSGWGRVGAISHYLLLSAVLLVAGLVMLLIGWGNLGYEVIMSPAGLVEKSRLGMESYRWDDLKDASERIKSTNFTLSFENEAGSCHVRFDQRMVGERIQDMAIRITEEAIRARPKLGISL